MSKAAGGGEQSLAVRQVQRFPSYRKKPRSSVQMCHWKQPQLRNPYPILRPESFLSNSSDWLNYSLGSTNHRPSSTNGSTSDLGYVHLASSLCFLSPAHKKYLFFSQDVAHSRLLFYVHAYCPIIRRRMQCNAERLSDLGKTPRHSPRRGQFDLPRFLTLIARLTDRASRARDKCEQAQRLRVAAAASNIPPITPVRHHSASSVVA